MAVIIAMVAYIIALPDTYDAMLSTGVTIYSNGRPVVVLDNNGNVDLPIVFEDKCYISENSVEQLLHTEVGRSTFGSLILQPSARDVDTIQYLDIYEDQEVLRSTKLFPDCSTNITVTNVGTTKLATSISKDIHKLHYGNKIYYAIEDVADVFNLYCEYSDGGRIDLMGTKFKEATSRIQLRDNCRVEIYKKDIDGFRRYVASQILKDSIFILDYDFKEDKNSAGTVYFENDSDNFYSLLWDRSDCQNEIESIVENIITPGMSDEDKVRIINEWICDQFIYDKYIGSNAPRTLHEVLGRTNQVCEGYSRLSVELCKACGIPAQYLVGYIDSENGHVCHAWYRVYVDNEWKYVDPVLNDNQKTDTLGVLESQDVMFKVHKEYSMAIMP